MLLLSTTNGLAQGAAASSSDQYVGEWKFANQSDGSRAAEYLANNGRFREQGQEAGFWHLAGGHLILTYKDHPFVHTFDLPAVDGVLHGHNKRGNSLTLSRPDASEGAAAPSGAKPVAAIATPPPPAPAKPQPTGGGNSGYFGTAQPGVSVPALPPVHGLSSVAPVPPAPSPTVPAPTATPAPANAPGPAPGQSMPGSAPDPIVGKWFWNADVAVTFAADGTCTSEQGSGTWQFLQNAEVERKYRVNWDQGRAIDRVTFSRDGQTARVVNQVDYHFDTRRALDMTAHPADHFDPLLGTWLWYNNEHTVTFKVDGTCASSIGESGVWQFNRNPESERKYHVVWDQGKFIDTLTLTGNGKVAHLVNQKGDRYDVHRSSGL